LRIISLAVVLTLVTNKNKCTQNKQYKKTVKQYKTLWIQINILSKYPHNCKKTTHYNTHTYTHPHITNPHKHTPSYYKRSYNNHSTRYTPNKI